MALTILLRNGYIKEVQFILKISPNPNKSEQILGKDTKKSNYTKKLILPRWRGQQRNIDYVLCCFADVFKGNIHLKNLAIKKI